MKKYSLFILTLLITVAFISCNKQKKSLESTSIENTKSENIQTEINSQEIKKENQIYQFNYDGIKQDEIIGIIPGENGRPDEVDIASGHKINIKDFFSKDMSSDGKYYIRDTGEYYYTYSRYCIPVEGERAELNLIMLKEESPVYNPNDMGKNEKDTFYVGCEFVPLARSKEPVLFNDQKSYWFKLYENEWIPGTSVYIQPGAFENLPVEDLEMKGDYEKIENGSWFIVNTDDGSGLRLRDSSNIESGKVISSIPHGTWIYADAQSTKTETIDGIESRWYKIIYPETGYVFGGYLEKQDDVCGLKFASMEVMEYPHDGSDNYLFKVYSAPSTKSEFLGEYEIKPDGYGYPALIETNKFETVDDVNGIWINIKEPVEGFIFGYNFIYK